VGISNADAAKWLRLPDDLKEEAVSNLSNPSLAQTKPLENVTAARPYRLVCAARAVNDGAPQATGTKTVFQA
jgi:hypothetical protein